MTTPTCQSAYTNTHMHDVLPTPCHLTYHGDPNCQRDYPANPFRGMCEFCSLAAARRYVVQFEATDEQRKHVKIVCGHCPAFLDEVAK